jgi:hypothetical protein
MTNLKFYPLGVLLLISLPLIAAADQISQFSLVAGTHRIVATIQQPESGFAGNAVLNFRSSADGRLLAAMKSDGFEAPMIFQHHGESFVHVSTTPAGSGAFVSDTIFWIAPDSTMHEIEFKNAAEAYENKVNVQETVLTGGPGVYCSGNQLKFEFYIAHDRDSHCCPTAGKVTGSYKITGEKKYDTITNSYSSTFKMMAGHYLRTPVSSGAIYANFRKGSHLIWRLLR